MNNKPFPTLDWVDPLLDCPACGYSETLAKFIDDGSVTHMVAHKCYRDCGWEWESEEFCQVHLTPMVDGVCPTCQQENEMWDKWAREQEEKVYHDLMGAWEQGGR